MMNRKYLKIKRLVVPERVYRQLDEIKVLGIHSFTDIVTDMGAIRDKNSYALAIGMIQPLKGLIKAQEQNTKKPITAKLFAEILSGIMFSYCLSYGKWERNFPIFMPEVPDSHELFKNELIETPNGKTLEVMEFMDKVMEATSLAHIEPIFNETFKKKFINGYKELTDIDCFTILIALINMSNEMFINK